MPTAQHDDNIKWAGFPFRSGYEEWCRLGADGKALVRRRQGEQGTT